MNVVGKKCVWLQNKERIDTHNNTVMIGAFLIYGDELVINISPNIFSNNSIAFID